ncbi:MAG: bis(5'-nucleosyl)-tetraphosphatase (symmetrical) YqeK [Bacillaceae bacterium]|nr:bis(5'-nucleosyl)-tetraphosphatase (symmetrical) YqeK [Bacillaceae bacterium]
MDVKKALQIVKPYLKPDRFEHTKRVVVTAVKLSEWYGEDVNKAEIAAAFHDYAKNRPKEYLKRWITKEKTLPKDLLYFHHELWHGPVGALLVEREFGIADSDILNAIRYHTTGRISMTKLEKIVFLADYIEPGRKFPGVDMARSLAREDLDQACQFALKNTIQFLMEKQQPIYPDTFFAYNDLTSKLNR